MRGETVLCVLHLQAEQPDSSTIKQQYYLDIVSLHDD